MEWKTIFFSMEMVRLVGYWCECIKKRGLLWPLYKLWLFFIMKGLVMANNSCSLFWQHSFNVQPCFVLGWSWQSVLNRRGKEPSRELWQVCLYYFICSFGCFHIVFQELFFMARISGLFSKKEDKIFQIRRLFIYWTIVA